MYQVTLDHELEVVALFRAVSSQDVAFDSCYLGTFGDNASVEEHITVNGNHSANSVDYYIGILEHFIDGRWYPKSIDNNVDIIQKGRSNDPYDQVMILADSCTDGVFNEFQRAVPWQRIPTVNTGTKLDC